MWKTIFQQDTESPGVGTVTATYKDTESTVASFTSRVDTNAKSFRDDFIAKAKQALVDAGQKKDNQTSVETLLDNLLNS